MNLRNRKWDCPAWIIFGLMGLAGSLVVAYCTAWGATVYSDATEYILSARSLLDGKGLGIPGPGGVFLPLTLHPPLYPLVLSGLGWMGLNLLEGARWLNVLLFGLVITLVSAAVYGVTRRFILAFLLGLVIFVSPLFLDIFSRAMAEALFFFLGLSNLFLFVQYLRFPRWRLLVGAGITAGLACLARYTGFVLVISGILLLLVFPKGNWKKRLLNLGIFIGLAGGLAATWLLPLYLLTQRMAARSLQLGEDLAVALRDARVALIDLGWSWLPFSQLIEPPPSYAFRGWLMTALLAVVGTVTLIVAWKRLRSPGRQLTELGLIHLAGVFGLFAAVYLLFITFSFFFSSPRNDLDGRLLSPFYLALILTIFPLLTWVLWGGRLSRWLAWIPALGLVVLAAGGLDRSADFVQTNHRSGSGYTSKAWLSSPAIRAVKELDPGIAVISNESAAILFLTDRPAYDVNELFRTHPSETFTRYGDDPDDPAQLLFQKKQAVLVVFPNTFYWQLFPIYGDRTQERLDALFEGLRVDQSFDDGVIYRYSQP